MLPLFLNQKTETVFFYIITLVGVGIIISNPYFVSLDGPSHLYNARLLKDITINNTLYSEYFTFFPHMVPNWITTPILMLLNIVFSPRISEKILVASILILTPVTFRYFLKQYKSDVWVSYFAIPFSYTFLFFLGFYNFSFAFISSFLTLGWYFKHKGSFDSKKYILLFILTFCVYYSHVFVSILTIMLMWGDTIYSTIPDIIDGFKIKPLLQRKNVLLILTTLPALIASILFFQLQPENVVYEYIPTKDLFMWIDVLRPIVVYNFGEEGVFTNKIVYLIIIALSIVFTQINFSKFKFADVFCDNFYFLWIVSGLLALLFIFPDGDGWAGYLSYRLLTLFFFFILVFIGRYKFSILNKFFLVSILLGLHFVILFVKMRTQNERQDRYVEVNSFQPFLKNKTTLQTVNLSGDWMHGHISGYLGTEKEVVVLENYEASTGYFPTGWKQEITFSNTTYKRESDPSPIHADFIFMINGNMDLAHPEFPDPTLANELKNLYRQVSKGKYYSLFELK